MPQTVLVADDDPNDQFFIGRELKKLQRRVEVQFTKDGEETIAYCKGEGKFADRSLYPLPCIIFIDIKMPRRNGFEVLAWVKSDATFRLVPAIVLSSSDAQRDIDKAYQLGANAYLVKPASVIHFERVFEITGKFFLEHARIPSLQPPA
jgi:CheY-like chemotaxis protein